MRHISLSEFIFDSGFYSDTTKNLYIEAMSHPTVPESSKGFIDRLLYEKYPYENYDIAPLDDEDELNDFYDRF